MQGERLMGEFTKSYLPKGDSNFLFLGFALNDCLVEADPRAARYVRAVHRTALELAVRNCFGADFGGFWLLQDQIAQLCKLAEHYPPNESLHVALAVEAYLRTQVGPVFRLALACEQG